MMVSTANGAKRTRVLVMRGMLMWQTDWFDLMSGGGGQKVLCDQGLWRVLVSVWGDENVQKKKEKKRREDWLVGVEGRVPEVLKRTEKGKKEGKGKGKGKGKGREK